MRALITYIIFGVASLTTLGQREADFLWVELRPSVEIAGLHVHLGDVAVLRALAPETEDRARRLVIGRVATTDVAFRLTQPTIRRLLQQGGFVERAISVTGASSVEVRSRTRRLTGSHMQRVARMWVLQHLKSATGVRDVSTASTLADITVPASRFRSSFRVDETALPKRLAGRVEIPCLVIIDGEAHRRVMVPVKIERRGGVVVIHRRISRGRMITPADIRTETRELGSLAADVLSDVDSVIGRIAVTALSPGQLVTRRSIREVPLVRRGDVVTARIEVGSLVVQALCRVQTEGAASESVLLTNIETKKTVRGIVIDSKTVRVPITPATTGEAP